MVKEIDEGTEEQILNAAYRVIVRHGKAGTRMQEIADEAGVNKALLHYYFRSKDKIYQAVLRTVAGKLLQSLMRSLDFELSLRELMESFVRGHIEAIRGNQEIFQFFFAEVWTNREEVLPVFKELLTESRGSLPARFISRLKRAVEEGEIRPVDPFHFLMNMVSLDVFYFVASPLFFSIMDVPPEEQKKLTDERAGQVVEFIWNSIRP
jgi:TetR/AcrR family transcriptional regulator